MLKGQNDNRNVDQIHAGKVLLGLLRMPGHIDDVARHMITLARQLERDKTIECFYGGIPLHARACSTVQEIRQSFERQCSFRHVGHCRHLRLVR